MTGLQFMAWNREQARLAREDRSPETLARHAAAEAAEADAVARGLAKQEGWEQEEERAGGRNSDPGTNFNPALAVPPPGRYQVEVLPRNIARVRHGEATGFAVWIGIIGGAFDCREIGIEFMTADPSGRLGSVVRHDMKVLAAWLSGLGIGPVEDELELVRKLIRKGAQHDVFATLGHKCWRRGLDLYISDIEVRP